MSELAGADLDQLDALAASYEARGAEIAERSRDVDRRIVETVTAFQGALTDLRVRAARANDTLLDDVDELTRTAAATTWTGANRTAFDDQLAVLERGITTTAEALTTGIVELERTGVAPFAEILAAFGRQATGAGESAEAAGIAMRTRVAGQRAELTDAADTGWWAV